MLCQSTCVGFGYGPSAGAVSRNPSPRPSTPTSSDKIQDPSRPAGRGVFAPVPIGYGSRPRLRGRLTLRGLALRRNPWTFGDRVSHPVCRYSCQHSRFRYLQGRSPVPLQRPTERSATAAHSLQSVTTRSFGAWLEPRYIFGAGSLVRPVSYYAFFKGWLLLSQPPGCCGVPTSFPTEPRLGGLSWRSGLFPSRRRTLAPAVCLPSCCSARHSQFGWVW